MPRPSLARRPVRLLPGALALATLAACGGGGSSGDAALTNSPTAAATPAPMAIVASNADTVAARGYEATTGLYDASSSATGQLKSVDGAGRFDVATFVLGHLRTPFATSGDGATLKAVQSATQNCPGGGSARITLDDRNNNGQADAGDTAAFVFANCVVDGARASGSMAFVFQSYASTATSETTQVAVTFTALTVVDASGTNAVDGDLTMLARVSLVAPLTSAVTLSGARLTVTEGGLSRTLTDYSGTLALDATAGTYAYTVSGTIAGGGLSGSLSVTTPTRIAGRIGSDPTEGVMLLTGANKSTVRVTVAPPSGVTLAIDANGDGTADSTKALTWAQFAAL